MPAECPRDVSNGLPFGEQAGSNLHVIRIVEQIARGARKPVQLPDNNDAARRNLIRHPLKFGPLACVAGKLSARDILATSLLQSPQLKV